MNEQKQVLGFGMYSTEKEELDFESIRLSKEECISDFCHAARWTRESLESNGFKCVPVMVTIQL